jgi:hypothetical protein
VSNNNSPDTINPPRPSEDQTALEKITVYNLCLKLRHTLNNAADDLNCLRTSLIRGTIDQFAMDYALASSDLNHAQTLFQLITETIHRIYPNRF